MLLYMQIYNTDTSIQYATFLDTFNPLSLIDVTVNVKS